MKKVMMMLMLVGVLSVSASADIVNTNFEAGSAGAGSWTFDPPNTWQQSLGGEIDPGSGVAWQDIGTSMFADVSEAVAGDQVAFLGSGDCARLRFAGDTGNDSGQFTTTAMMFQHDATNEGGYTFLMGRNGPDGTAAAWEISWEVRMHNTTNGSVELQAWDGATLTTLTVGLAEHAWYDVKIDADYDTNTYDVSYRTWTSGGSNSWVLGADDFDFLPDDDVSGHDGWGGGDAFQVLDTGCSGAYGMVDNIVVVPEPATMVLLGLGSLLAIRRKK
ncbi:MAG: PEP-CTERM sorting domain-containing protein [Anaerohalosphaeraceae bacterium]|nr:PEP-CTERM sorting domain-containing protein [Anaerohalosphaeraceae bacterium]